MSLFEKIRDGGPLPSDELRLLLQRYLVGSIDFPTTETMRHRLNGTCTSFQRIAEKFEYNESNRTQVENVILGDKNLLGRHEFNANLSSFAEGKNIRSLTIRFKSPDNPLDLVDSSKPQLPITIGLDVNMVLIEFANHPTTYISIDSSDGGPVYRPRNRRVIGRLSEISKEIISGDKDRARFYVEEYKKAFSDGPDRFMPSSLGVDFLLDRFDGLARFGLLSAMIVGGITGESFPTYTLGGVGALAGFAFSPLLKREELVLRCLGITGEDLVSFRGNVSSLDIRREDLIRELEEIQLFGSPIRGRDALEATNRYVNNKRVYGPLDFSTSQS